MRYLLVLSILAFIGCGGDSESGSTDPEADAESTAGGPSPADMVRAVAQVNPVEVAAGEPATVTCTFEDAAGNVIEGVAWVVSAPEALTVADHAVSSPLAGSYEISCAPVEGALDEQLPATLVVVPGAAVSLTLQLDPELTLYAANQLIGVTGVVIDAHGNALPGPVALELTATPDGSMSSAPAEDGDHQVIGFSAGGTYTLTGKTKTDPPVTALRQLIVDGEGPVIIVDSPSRGATENGSAERQVKGTVTDDRPPVAWFKVGGEPFGFDKETGAFGVNVPLAYGNNVVHLSAADTAGNVAESWTSIAWSSDWYPLAPPKAEDDSVLSGLVIAFGPEAVDDGDHDPSKVNDLATIFEVVIASFDLEGLVPDPLFSGLLCDYHMDKLSWTGATVDLSLTDGALGIVITFLDFDLRISNSGGLLCSLHNGKEPGDLLDGTGPLKFFTEKLKVTGKVTVDNSSGDAPEAKLSIDDLDSQGTFEIGTPIIGDIVDEVLSFFLGLFKGLIADQLNGVIGGLFEAFSFNTTFEIPSPATGGAPNEIALTTAPAAITFTTEAMRIEMHAMAHTTSPNRPHEVLGSVAYAGCGPASSPPGAPPSPLMLGLHDDVLNQILFGVWEGGTLSLELDGDALGDFDAEGFGISNLSIVLDAHMPLFFNSCGGTERIQIGDLYLDATFDFLEQPVHLTFWVQGDAPVVLGVTTNEDGSKQLGFELQGLDGLTLEIAGNEGFFEGKDDAVLDLVQTTLLPKMLGALTGGLGSFPLPSIDLSSFSESIPPGTGIDLNIQSTTREGAYLLMLGTLNE